MSRVRLFLEKRIAGGLDQNHAVTGVGVMKRVGILLAAAFCVLIFDATAFGTTYFSQTSGAPNTQANWNTNRAGGGTSPANFTAGDIFVIQGTGNGGTTPHSMTTTATWTVSGTGAEVQVENGASLATANTTTVQRLTILSGGTASVTGGVTLTVNDGNAGGVDLSVAGTLSLSNASAAFAYGGAATGQFLSGGKFTLARNGGGGGVVPTATWDANSTCEITGITSTVPPGLGQSFGNVTWNCSGQTVNSAIGNALTTQGDLNIQNTGSGALHLPNDSANTVGGDYVQSGGSVQIGNNNASSLTVSGSFTMSGGTFTKLGDATPGLTINVAGHFSLTGGTLDGGASGLITVVFNGNVTQTYKSGGTVSNAVNFTVNSGTTLQMDVAGTVVSGTTFTLSSGATLGIRSTVGITSSGATGNVQTTTRTFSTGANYIYNGSANQAVGNGLPATVNSLTVANTGAGGSNIVTLAQNTAVTSTLTVSSGVLDLSTFTANRSASGGTITVSNGATLKIGGTNSFPSNYTTHTLGSTSTVEYSGTNQTVTAESYGHLTLSGSGTKTMPGTTTTVAGDFTMAGTASATAGATINVSGKVTLGSGTSLDGGTFTHTVGGDWTNNGGTFTPSTSTITFNSTTVAQAINGTVSSQTFNSITVSKSGQTLSVSGSTTTLAINGTLTLTAGTLAAGTASNINIAVNWTNNGGAFTPGSGTVTFNSTTAAQAINGSASTQTFNNLTINKSGQTLSVGGSTTTLTLNSDLTITAGGFSAGTATTINVAGSWTNNSGTGFTSGSSNVVFNGSAGQIAGSQPTSFNGLTVGHANGLTIATSGSFTTFVTGTLALTSGDLNTGAHTLEMGSNAPTSTGTGDVVGNVTRTDIASPLGTTRTFGNPNVKITESVGTISSITVNLVKNTTTSKSTSVKRLYTITPGGGTLTNATLRLHYLGTELNGNSDNTGMPCTLQLWREDTTTHVWSQVPSTDCNNNDPNRWVESSGVTAFSPWTIAPTGVPTSCKLEAFAASRSDDGVVLEWRTGYEVNNVGFNIYKQDQSGTLVRLTPNPVAGSALMVRRGTPLTAGLSYSWTDPGTKSGETPRYWLEDIDASGQNVWNGPFWIDETGKPSRPPSPGGGRSVTINSMNAQVAKEIASSAKGFQYEPVAQMETKAKPGKLKGSDLTQQLDLAGNPAVKISVRQEGWYRVNQPDLVAAGLDASVDPHNLQLYVGGQQIPMIVNGEDDGKFDPQDSIEFYGLGLDTSSTDTRVYWLTAGQDPGDRIKAFKGSPKGSAGSGFQYTVQRKDRLFYFSNIPNGDRENFFGAFIFNQPTDQTMTASHIAPAANATLEVAMQGFNAGPHNIGVSVNGTLVGTLSFNDQAYSISTLTFAQSLLTEGTNTVTMVAQAGSSDFSFVDYMRLTYLHSYDADNNSLKITAGAAQSVTVNGFSDPAIRVIDVTDATTPKWMLGRVSQTPQGYSVLLATSGGTGTRTLLVFADSQVKSAAKVAANGLSSLRQPLNSADLLVVSYGAFSSSLQSLLSLRESQGLRTQLVDIEDVYDEFNAGSKSPQALKDFLSYAHTNWKKRPRYVLLAGSASFDPRNYLGLGDTDFVPTMFVQTEHIETASDDALADFNDDGIPEMAVGRLPALTAQEATTMVNKVVGYDQGAKGDGVLLVADINDGFDFEGADDQLRSLVPAGTNVQEIRRSSDPQAEQDLLNALNQGKGLVNYVGHGSVNLWRANLLVSTDGASLTNTQRLSIFVAMTCLNGYFIDQRSESLAHALMNSPGGAAAVWSSSGLTEPDAQALANQELFRQIFNGASARLGDATIKAKAAISDLDVRRTWILIGDPTTRLK